MPRASLMPRKPVAVLFQHQAICNPLPGFTVANDLSFPLALCKAQWSIWLHTLEMLESLGAHVLEGQAAQARAGVDEVMRAEDWHSLALTPVHALLRAPRPQPVYAALQPTPSAPAASPVPSPGARATPMSRRSEVQDALHTLHDALGARRAASRHGTAKAAGKAAARRRKT